MKRKGPNILSLSLVLVALAILGASVIFYEIKYVPPVQNVYNEKGNFVISIFEPKKGIEAKTFSSEKEFASFITSHSSSGNYLRGFGGIEVLARPMPDSISDSGVALAESLPSSKATAVAEDYSKTNVQVKGVDEADIIKTDGKYIYTITGNTLFIIKAYPGDEAQIISTITFKKKSPKELFVEGDKLAVFGGFNDIEFMRKMNFRALRGMSFFDIYDISDRKNPSFEKSYKIEGNYFRARMKNGYVYFLTQLSPRYAIGKPSPPVILYENEKYVVPPEDIYYFSIPYSNPYLVTINAINMKNPQERINSKSVLVEGIPDLYMSHENIYITYPKTISEWDIQKKIVMQLLEKFLTEEDKKLIQKIKETDNEVLSQTEKEAKIFAIIQSYANYIPEEEKERMEKELDTLLKKELEKYDYFEYTIISRISYDNGEMNIEANGKVPGRIINQFSMDENNGIFRIATTLSGRQPRILLAGTVPTSSNNVYALNSNLDIIGRLEGLAKGERIFSTRFMGDRLYMVTFRQVDPFFVIDLSDPENIMLLGDLKIPGFSRYLHPYDEDTIIGIGHDATERGMQLGLKISLFDVSDVSKPKEIVKFSTDERFSRSTALYNHHAFLFSKEKNLLVIPVYSGYYAESEKTYNGAFVFHITKDEIKLRGLIDHSRGMKYWQPVVEISLYINELLYTKSPYLLRINKIDDLSSVKDVELKTENKSKFPIY